MTLTQRSTEWRMLRCGDVTASRFRDIKSPRSKSDGVTLSTGVTVGQTALSYLEELLAELITGKPQDRLGNVPSIQHGNFYEDVHRESAQEVLRERFGEELVLPEGEYAYTTHPTEPHIGCSPDYVVGETKGGEMKCLWNPAKHVCYLRRGVEWFMKENVDQVQGAMWINDWEGYYVSSFHPDFPDDQKLVLWYVERDEKHIEKLAKRVIGFRDLLLDEYQRLIGGPF